MFKKYHAFAFVEKRSNELASCARLALTEGTLEYGIEKVDEWLIREGMKEVSCCSSEWCCVKKEVRPRALPFVIFCKLELLDNKIYFSIRYWTATQVSFVDAYEQHRCSPFRLSSFLPDFSHARLQPSQQSNFLSGRIPDISLSDVPRAPSFNRIKNESKCQKIHLTSENFFSMI